MSRTKDGDGGRPAPLHWLLRARIEGGEAQRRGEEAIRSALDEAKGQPSGAARRLGYPWPAFLTLIDSYGLFGYSRDALRRAREHREAEAARERMHPGPKGHWITQAAKEEATPREREEAIAAIKGAIEAEAGDVMRAAKRLGVSHQTLYRRLDDFDLEWFPVQVRADVLRREKKTDE